MAKPIQRPDVNYCPKISFLIPVHNEASVIKKKLENILKLDYPRSELEVLFISDGSVDETNSIIKEHENDFIRLIEIKERKGKANALNMGLQAAKYDILVFSDASIMLDKSALKQIVNPLQDASIGCVSGEDHITEAGGEGAYGRYELWIRNLESRIHSVVGASGSFYAQRKSLCTPFGEGIAPDFLSVLNTVEKGYRAITEPKAFGFMSSVKETADEFNRKIRTLIRGMAALSYKSKLLNMFQYGIFSFELISHKLMRWLVPFFLVGLYLSNLFLLEQLFYVAFFVLQTLFYILAYLAFKNKAGLGEKFYGKIALYFTMVNISILIAWLRYWFGVRQEIWNPTNRA